MRNVIFGRPGNNSLATFLWGVDGLLEYLTDITDVVV